MTDGCINCKIYLFLIKSIPIIEMKIKSLASLIIVMTPMLAGQKLSAQTVTNRPVEAGDRQVVFGLSDAGTSMPIAWGLDTAWPDRANMIRGVRFLTPEVVTTARVSFQPWAKIEEKGVLPELLMKNLKNRMDLVALIGHKVDIALNLDAGEPTLHDVYDGQAMEWALLIDATAAAVEDMGYNVVSAAPFNEPDDPYNGLTDLDSYGQRKLNFNRINIQLKKYENFPRFEHIRISGGNTLNSDEAWPWYETLRKNLDEGNTHQLAGSFDNYASFFQKVRADGRYATADELHNVMEAMVGVEYGMQTGIWWGHADLVRGEFCQASGGKRLAYAENRQAWSSAAVYRAPSGKVQGFVGSSERQAEPSSYRFVSAEEDVYFDGFGPTREFTTFIPGDYDTYQGPHQTSAEAVFAITCGEDVQPAITGESPYVIMNMGTKKAMQFDNGSDSDLALLTVASPTKDASQQWKVERVPNTVGGDYSGYYIRNSKSDKMADVYNFTLEEGGEIIQWGFGGGHNQQWYPIYAGDNSFRIRSRWSGLYLTANGDGKVTQEAEKDDATQFWRFVDAATDFETTAPQAPTALKATAHTDGVELAWTASTDGDTDSYVILRSTAGSGFNTIARGVKGTEYRDLNTVPGTAYAYKVVAQDASLNRSEASETVETSTADGRTLRADFALNGNLADASNGFELRTYNASSFTEGQGADTKALKMDGDQWAQLPYTLLQLKEMTVAMTVKRDAGDGSPLLCTGVPGKASLTLYAEKDGNVSLEATKGDATTSVTAPAAQAGEWMHVAAVIADGKMKLYTDGTEAGEAAMGLTPAEMLLSYLGRGQESADEGENFRGAISNLKVYSYALTPEDVAKLAGGESGLQEITDNDEATSVRYYDASGREVKDPQRGSVVVKKTTYASGRTSAEKITFDR